jgi:hypothetical protein
MWITQSRVSGRLPLVLLVLSMFYLLAETLMAGAQVSTPSVTGAVTDSTGALVPGARAVLTNVGTNVERTTISNGSGSYTFVSVPPLRYTLIFSAPSFQSQKIAPFDLGVDQTVNIDASLKVGNEQVSVTIEAVTPQVETTTSELGTVMSTKEVNDLPLNGRNFT